MEPLAADDCVFGASDASRARAGEAYFRLEGAGAVLVRNGREIVVEPEPKPSEPLLRALVYRIGFGMAMQQRGALVLHASAVAVEEGALLFVGEAGWGKSTLAAALWQRGARLLCDDVAVVDEEEGRLVALPGCTMLKLWPDSLRALGYPVEELEHVRPDYEKRVRPVEGSAEAAPARLARVYVLGIGEAPALEPLSGSAAFLELVAHSFFARLLPADGQESHFRRCARVAREVPMRRLSRPVPDESGALNLSSLLRLIDDDLRAS